MPLPSNADLPDAAAPRERNQRLAQLIELAAAGDIRAFETLYDTTSTWLLARVRRIAGDAHAEDVLTEVYLHVWRDLARFDEARGDPLAWLATIARSRALDRLRREAVRPWSHIQPLAEEGSVELSHNDGPESRLLHRQQMAALQLAIARLLSPRERMVLGLAYFRDCSHSEIATLTGMPIGTVKTLLHRSQKKLRDDLTSVDTPAAARAGAAP